MMDNLLIIGTSHIAKQSINEIRKSFQDYQPDIIAVELDLSRANAILSKEKSKIGFYQILQIGLKGYLFAKIGQIVQQKLGKVVGISPGSEMKTALELARKNKKETALNDQPIQITLKKFSKSLGWQEKWRFFVDVVKGIFNPRGQIKKLGLDQFDLTKVPDEKVIEKMVSQLEERYPSIYKTLVSDRNRYMVKKLVRVMRAKPGKKILVVVGAGHKKGMEELLLKVDMVR